MLSWQVELGADEAMLDTPSKGPVNLTVNDLISAEVQQISTSTPTQAANVSPNLRTSDEASLGLSNLLDTQSRKTLDHLKSLKDLAAAVDQLDGCPLKHTASTMCFADGIAGARLMIIGEAPSRDEDRLGLPFVGAAGQLLDSMIASIGLDRSGVYLTNFLPWRPPGNRMPTSEEIDMLLPFLYRHIQLANPELVIILGGTPAKTMLQSGDNILKLRGRWQDRDFGDGVTRPTMASLHPAYLMRSPAQKRLAFDDWCGLYYRLNNQLDNKSPPANA